MSERGGMWNLKAMFVALLTAGLLAIPLTIYWERLTRGQRPPEATQLLDRLEKEGLKDFRFPNLQGNNVSFEDFHGRIVLINLWATWCAPCVKEFPSLKRLVEHFKGQVVVLAVSHDSRQEDVESFVRAFGPLPEGFHVLMDVKKQSGKRFRTIALPETYIFSTQGRLLRKIVGETTWDDPMALQFFKDHLAMK